MGQIICKNRANIGLAKNPAPQKGGSLKNDALRIEKSLLISGLFASKSLSYLSMLPENL